TASSRRGGRAVTSDRAPPTATLNPTTALSAGATYTATVHGGAADPRVKDAAGNALAASVVWSFTVQPADTTPPTITAVSPASGATNVALASSVGAVFSEAMDGSTINGTTVELRNAASQLVAAAVT